MEWKKIECGYLNLELKLIYRIWEHGPEYKERYPEDKSNFTVSFVDITSGGIGFTIAEFEEEINAHEYFQYLIK